MVSIKENVLKVNHPLAPLTVEEVQEAMTILKSEIELGEKVRFPTVTLREPVKEIVLNFVEGSEFPREVFIVVLDNAEMKTYEAIVSLNTGSVVSYEEIEGVQPSIMPEESIECENIVKANPDFLAALAKRGIDNADLVMVDPWSAGYFDIPENEGKRIARAISWVKKFPEDNGYAYPLTGVVVYVDLNRMEVDRVEDHGVREMPTMAGNYYPEVDESIEFRKI